MEVRHETVRFWWNKFGSMLAAKIRRRHAQHFWAGSIWQSHLDEVFVNIYSEIHYLSRAVDLQQRLLVVAR